jgi:hypothetical protein
LAPPHTNEAQLGPEKPATAAQITPVEILQDSGPASPEHVHAPVTERFLTPNNCGTIADEISEILPWQPLLKGNGLSWIKFAVIGEYGG